MRVPGSPLDGIDDTSDAERLLDVDPAFLRSEREHPRLPVRGAATRLPPLPIYTVRKREKARARARARPAVLPSAVGSDTRCCLHRPNYTHAAHTPSESESKSVCVCVCVCVYD